MVTALKHRPWRLSRFSDSTPRTLSSWAQMWAAVLDVLLDWAHECRVQEDERCGANIWTSEQDKFTYLNFRHSNCD